MDAVSILLDMGADTSEVPERLILLPRTTKVDFRIQAMKQSNTSWPLCVRDIYQICFHFKETFFVPIPVTARILDMAELWVQSSVMRNDLQVYDESAVRTTYLQSASVAGRDNSPLQKVVFTITSHDQAWDSDPGSTASWIWFESRRLRSGFSKNAVGLHIVHNRHANAEWFTHNVTWSRPESRRDLKSVKPGDQISVVACARFPCWLNFVGETRIDIFTSILRRHYTNKEISEIWDTASKDQLRGSDVIEQPLPKAEGLALRYKSPLGSKLRILAAEYGTLEVSELVAELLVDNQLKLEPDVYDRFFSDPWIGVVKSLTILFTFDDDEPQLLITAQNQGSVSINSDMGKRKLGSIPPPNGAAVHIIAIIYGTTEIKDETIYKNMYTAIAQKQDFAVTNEALGGDTWLGNAKSCVV